MRLCGMISSLQGCAHALPQDLLPGLLQIAAPFWGFGVIVASECLSGFLRFGLAPASFIAWFIQYKVSF